MSKRKRITYNVIQGMPWGWLEMKTDGPVILWQALDNNKNKIGKGAALDIPRAKFLARRAFADYERQSMNIIKEKDEEIARLKKLLQEQEIEHQKALHRAAIVARQRAEDDAEFDQDIQKGKVGAYQPGQTVILQRAGRVVAAESEVVRERFEELRDGSNIEVFENVEARRAARRGTHAGFLTGAYVNEQSNTA